KGLKRTHRCGELSASQAGQTVTIMGWVQKNRNKGGLVFVDVRDRSGVIQVVFEEGKADAALLEKAAKLRAEYVVAITGRVEMRSGAVNENLATGEIEIIPESLRILSESETPRSEEHTSELQSRFDRVCRLLLEKTKHWRRPE